MSFELMFHEDSATGLVAICDVCNKRIYEAPEALICWIPNDDGVKCRLIDYRICHKHCVRVLDKRFGHQFTQELDVGIGYLMNNTKTKYDKMRQKMGLLDMIG